MVKYLPDLLPIADPTAYKLHFARYNKEAASRGFRDVEPVKVLLRSCEKLRAGEPWTDWHNWQAYRPRNNMFNRDYIFTLARCYQQRDLWLFGGVFAVVARQPGQDYVVELTDEGADMIGHLTLRYDYTQRAARVNFEKHYENLEIASFSRATGRGDG